MKFSLPLDKMTTSDKISVMETIWDDLCRNAESLSSPDWHKQVLLERNEEIKNGSDDLLDWDIEKKNIQNSIK